MRLRELQKKGAGILSDSGIAEAGLDSRILLCHVLGIDTAGYLSVMEREAEKYTEDAFLDLIGRRAGREPLQYVMGYTEFMGLRFNVDSSVLIPRQDTELLCELVLSDNPQRDISLLDLCTGSGAIALALGVLGGYEKVIGTDISEAALGVAEKNREALGAKNVSFYRSDMFSGLEALMKQESLEGFDILVSNPPYIRDEVIATLEPEVRDHEPRGALSGMEDGLHFYRIIAEEAFSVLKKGGRLYLEIGSDQGPEVRDILSGAGYKDIKIYKDYCGNDRVVHAGIGS